MARRTLIIILFVWLSVPASAQIPVDTPGNTIQTKRNVFEDPPPIPDPGGGGCPDFDYCLADYAALRAQTCNVNETAEVTDSRYGGGFDCVTADPYSNGDDSTLVFDISGDTDWWVRDFSCTQATCTQGDPIELDWYEKLAEDYNITHWLESMKTNFAPVVWFRASDVAGVDTVISRNIDFATGTDWTDGGFLESTDSLWIKFGGGHANERMWEFTNYNNLTFGGPNLYLFFVGTQTGLGNSAFNTPSNEANGLLDFSFSGNHQSATLLDLHANFHWSQSAGVNHSGGSGLYQQRNRVTKIILGGEYLSSRARMNSGFRTIEFDSVQFKDPFLRHQGWDGGNAQTIEGRSVGCTDDTKSEQRHGSQFQYAEKLTGVIAVQWGHPEVNIFMHDQAGNSINDPLKVYFKDWGSSGPTSLTGLPQGVAGKAQWNGGIMKHDPTYPANSAGDPNKRFIKFIEVTPDYGNGVIVSAISGSCEPGNVFNNNTLWSSAQMIWLSEASGPGYVTAYNNIGLEMTTAWNFLKPLGQDDRRMALLQTYTNSATDRAFGNRFTINSPTDMGVDGMVELSDIDTLSGTGTVGEVWVFLNFFQAAGQCNGNVITDEGITVSDRIKIKDACTLKLSNVTFSASSQDVMEIASGATVTVPSGAGNGLTSTGSGAQITGSGTLNCNGSGVTLPYDFDTDTECEY